MSPIILLLYELVLDSSAENRLVLLSLIEDANEASIGYEFFLASTSNSSFLITASLYKVASSSCLRRFIKSSWLSFGLNTDEIRLVLLAIP